LASIYPFFRSLLFRLEPEQAHHLTLDLMRLAGVLPPVRDILHAYFSAPQKPVQAFGLTFPNPVGLAAGYDKDGFGWQGLTSLGFGHIEIGTVTPRPQPGNPKPRVFRLIREQALINRMGFPGSGAQVVAQQIKPARPYGVVLGVNIGKNKDTPLEKASEDYLCLFDIFAPLADYLAVNVSSPNTVGLRRLQSKAALIELLEVLARRRQEVVRQGGRQAPILVKLAPDLSDEELDDALDAIIEAGMDGVIATNTTIQRDGLHTSLAQETGGLSGLPLRSLSTEMVRKIVQRTAGKLPVIGVGGISDAASAREKLDAGATLVQVYTGMIYRGPALIQEILRGL
jgi:dihydroorotate dehydrogenase